MGLSEVGGGLTAGGGAGDALARGRQGKKKKKSKFSREKGLAVKPDAVDEHTSAISESDAITD